MIKDGSQQEMKQVDDHQQAIMEIIQKQRTQLAEIQESLDELERRISR